MRSWAWWVAAIGCGCVVGGADPDTDTDTGADPGHTDEPGGCAAEDLTVEIGTGETNFVPLAPGDPVTMVHGPQGGWHVDVSGRVGNTRQTVSVRPSVVLETGESLAGDQVEEFVALALFDEGACTGEFWGRRAFLDDHPSIGQPLICSLDGAAATVFVDVVDLQDGRAVTGSLPVVLRLDPTDVPLCD